MYIYKIIIENFRNFEKFKWNPNERINIIFGHNGCGKTNLAEAIKLTLSTNNYEAFFEESDYYCGDTSKKIKIQLWISDVEPLKAHISECLQHIDKDDNFVCDDSAKDSKPVIIYQLSSNENGMMEYTFYQQVQLTACSSSDRRAVDFIHIDADRQPLKEIGLQSKSTFYKMAYKSIESEIKRISKEIVDVANSELDKSEILKEYMSEQLIKDIGEIEQIEGYKLLLKSPMSTWNYSGFELGTSVGSAKVSFAKQSKGIRGMFLLLMMKKHLEGAGIVFVEELEQNLEPKNQRRIADEFRKLNVGQIFITSHSPDIISHFNFANIGIMKLNTVTPILKDLTPETLKEIYIMNKKSFISALMSENILLVEGESEYEAFQVYSSYNEHSLDEYDFDVFKVSGKEKLKQYCEAFKHFGKKVFILLDNDIDIDKTIRSVADLANEVLVSMDEYEDFVYPYYENYISLLNELVPYSKVKNKLNNIIRDDKVKAEKKRIRNYMLSINYNLDIIQNYSDLAKDKTIFKYVLHDSFITRYFARAIANAICQQGIIPMHFQNLVLHISNRKKGNLKNGYANVYEIKGE